MTALTNRATRVVLLDRHLIARAFARLLQYLNLLAEGIVEGYDMARAAKKRHPFADG